MCVWVHVCGCSWRVCVCVCVGGCGRLRVGVGWQVPHCLRHFCPNSAKRRKPWRPLPHPPLPHSPWLPGASMSTHPSLPTCSPEPRALWSALSLPTPLLLPSLPLSPLRSYHSQREEAEEEEGSCPKCRPTEHSSPGGWEGLKPKSLNSRKEEGKGAQGQSGAGLKSIKGKKGGAPTTLLPGPQCSATDPDTPILVPAHPESG